MDNIGTTVRPNLVNLPELGVHIKGLMLFGAGVKYALERGASPSGLALTS